MAGRTDGLIKTFRAAAAIAAHRIVMFGANDDEVATAGAAGDASIGVTLELDAAAGEPVDVAMSDIVDVVYGGAVTRGEDLLTADAEGRAVAAAPAAGVTNRIIGIPLCDAVAGDIGPMLIAPSRITG